MIIVVIKKMSETEKIEKRWQKLKRGILSSVFDE